MLLHQECSELVDCSRSLPNTLFELLSSANQNIWSINIYKSKNLFCKSLSMTQWKIPGLPQFIPDEFSLGRLAHKCSGAISANRSKQVWIIKKSDIQLNKTT